MWDFILDSERPIFLACDQIGVTKGGDRMAKKKAAKKKKK
jgi:hypothetical protein